MDLRQLQSLLAVADHGSFSSAAEALFTVQSNVSAHVARLESELGITLIERRTKTLTPAGQVVGDRAREILRAVDAIPEDLAELENRIVGEVAVGTTPVIGPWLLPAAVAAAVRDFPEVEITLIEGQSENLTSALESEQIDIAIVSGAVGSKFSFTPLFTEDIVAIVPPRHHLEPRTSLTKADLADADLILPLRDNPMRTHIDLAFARDNLAVRDAYEVGSSLLAVAMAQAGTAVALVPASTSTSGPGRHRALGTPIADLAPRNVALITRTGPQRQVVSVLADILKSVARKSADEMPGCEVA